VRPIGVFVAREAELQRQLLTADGGRDRCGRLRDPVPRLRLRVPKRRLQELRTGHVRRRERKKAREDTIKQFEGQNIVTLESSYKATIAAALEEAGLTYSDVDVTNFNEGARSRRVLRGEGDIFMGGLTETGPPGLWFSNAFVLQPYLEENRQQLLDLTAIWYRTMKYLKEDKEKSYPIMLKELNAQASTELDTEGLEQLIPEFEYFPTEKKRRRRPTTRAIPVTGRPAPNI
jgi:hypothetical protein